MKHKKTGGYSDRGIPDGDIRWSIFRMVIILSMVMSAAITLVNAVNHRPAVNIVTGLVLLVFSGGIFLISRDSRRYQTARIIFLGFYAFFWMPFGYVTSPGTASAMPYMILAAIFLETLICRQRWEYIFPAFMIIATPYLMYLEVLKPELFEDYLSNPYRMRDLIVNFPGFQKFLPH